MSLLDDLGDIVKRATSGNASTADVHAAYDQVTAAVGDGVRGEAIAIITVSSARQSSLSQASSLAKL